MDKFGIFKLLNSFYDFYNKNKQATNEKNIKEIPPTEKEKLPPSIMPLQSSMIKTMTSHDELVKRVMQNTKKQHPQK